jgi:hypothetical protein
LHHPADRLSAELPDGVALWGALERRPASDPAEHGRVKALAGVVIVGEHLVSAEGVRLVDKIAGKRSRLPDAERRTGRVDDTAIRPMSITSIGSTSTEPPAALTLAAVSSASVTLT